MNYGNFFCLVVTEDEVPIGIITGKDVTNSFIATIEQGQSLPIDVKISSIMSTEMVCVQNDTNILDALNLIQPKRIRHLPIVDKQGKLCGIVTHSDLIRNKRYLLNKYKQSNEKLDKLSKEDPLLGIGNRRAMDNDLQHTSQLSRRYNHSYSLALMDLDFFKQYNDFYGHMEGDNMLKKVTNYIQKHVRECDRLYRFGGEEFLLLLPQSTLNNAEIVMKKIIQGFAAEQYPHESNPYNVVTISAGLACFDPKIDKEQPWRDLLECTDTALYQAKENGRNQFAVYDQAPEINTKVA